MDYSEHVAMPSVSNHILFPYTDETYLANTQHPFFRGGYLNVSFVISN